MLYFNKKGTGKNVVLLHGFLENSKMWSRFQEELSKDYCVISIDLPGHGKSTAETQETNRMEDMADKVNEVLEFLDVNEIVVMGHSMGGYVSLAFADNYRHKVSGLGLLFSTALPDSDAKKEQRLKAAKLVVKNPQEFFRHTVPSLFVQETLPNFRKEAEEAVAWANETSPAAAAAATRGMRLRPDRVEVIKDLEKPVLVLAGEKDKSVQVDELKKAIADCENVTFYELPAGHMGIIEMPKESLNIVKNWLAEVL